MAETSRRTGAETAPQIERFTRAAVLRKLGETGTAGDPSSRRATAADIYDPTAVATAWELADHDPRRMLGTPDGAITIVNNPENPPRLI